MRSKIRVLIVSDVYPSVLDFTSGIFVHQQAKLLRETENCEVVVVSPVPFCPFPLNYLKRAWRDWTKTPFSDVIENIPVYYPRYFRLPGKIFDGLAFYGMHIGAKGIIKKIIAEFKPDILHIYGLLPSGCVGPKLKNKYHIPFVCTLLGSDVFIRPYYNYYVFSVAKKILLDADHLIAHSRALKTAAEKIGKTNNKISVLHFGCNVKKFCFDDSYRKLIRNKLNINVDDTVLVFVGCVYKQKGIYELLESFTHLVDKYKDVHLIVVGDGPDYKKVEYKAKYLSILNKFHMVGSQPHDLIPQFLSAADIFVLPSYSEGLCYAAIEAMSCSRPVVVSRVGGLMESVEDIRSGIMVEPRDVVSLTDAIERLICDEGLCARMGSYGRQIAEKRFSLEKDIRSLGNLYKALM